MHRITKANGAHNTVLESYCSPVARVCDPVLKENINGVADFPRRYAQFEVPHESLNSNIISTSFCLPSAKHKSRCHGEITCQDRNRCHLLRT